MATKMPKELLVYVADYDRSDHNAPIFGVARNVDEIPHDSDGEPIGVYVLNRTAKYQVKTELK